MAERPSIDVYAVGVLYDLIILGRAIRRRDGRAIRWALGCLGRRSRLLWDWARVGNWRAVKNSFNGYLAEPVAFPAGLRRCGSGWTRKRALRSLARHARKAANRRGSADRGLL